MLNFLTIAFTISFLIVFVSASNETTTRISWYNNQVWNHGDRRRASLRKDIWHNGGLWLDNKNWNTGHVWNINSVWKDANKGITYHYLCDMNHWKSLPERFNVAYDDLSKCTTWSSFKKTFKKSYNTNHVHELTRYSIFVQNLMNVINFNMAAETNFTVGINRLADMTSSEITSIYNGYKSPANYSTANDTEANIQQTKRRVTPRKFDWRKLGAVTPVKDQGQCGSCWAFSSTGSLETQLFIKTGKLVSLSEQNLVDCTSIAPYTNGGCDGGWMADAFVYAKISGIASESSYPYLAVQQTCNQSPAHVAFDTGYVNVASNEAALTRAIATIGTISVAIDASHSSFQMYSSGVYHEASCSPTNLDHAVLAVGYDTLNALPYYIVKNSWGTGWGQQGYILMTRNGKNNCGIASAGIYPTEPPQPKTGKSG